MQIPSQIEYMLRKLADNGYEAYLVGGCVRDFLLKKTPNDYDITTSALPEETMAVFENDRVIPTGLKHGTVTVLYDGVSAEITTYRTETTYSDNRHPDKVEFSKNISDDLRRRDFTVNAMAIGLDGKFVDLYGGESDLVHKTVRTVGEPKERFSEDALRILRAFRFASKLGFEIEKDTLDAAVYLAKRLVFVSRERIFEEFSKLLCGVQVGRVLQIMYEGRIFDSIFENPKINTDAFLYIDTLPRREDIRFSALFIDDENITEHAASLKTSKEFVYSVKRISECALPRVQSKSLIRKLIYESGKDAALARALIEQKIELHDFVLRVIDEENCFSLSDLDIDGKEIMSLTGCQGKEVGALLNTLLFAVFDEKVRNSKVDLTEYLKKVDKTEKV